MDKQVIISIGREFGSGGHIIAEELAKRFDIPLYDRNILDHIAEEKCGNSEELKKYDERMKKFVISRRVRGFSNSPEEVIAELQFEFLENKAKKGESFVVVGRCAESVLKEFDGLISVFITGDKSAKCERVMALKSLSEKEAVEYMARHDRYRKRYHNHHCEMKWGDSRNYDLCVNSSKLGIKRTVDMLERYIKERSI